MKIFFSLSLQHFGLELLIDWYVIQQKLPSLAPILRECLRYSVPCDVPQLVQFNIWLIRVEHLVDLHALLCGLALLNIAKDLVFILLCWLVERRVLYLFFQILQPIWQMLGSHV